MSNYFSLVIGLTGSIGSGKTLIAKVFKHLGVPVYLSDQEAKKLYLRDNVIAQIKDMFSQEVMTDGQVNKRKLAELVFKDKKQLNKLNNCIHPLVKQDFEQWVGKQRAPYVIMESAIIYEAGWDAMFDKIISVSTPMNLMLERVQVRDNQTKEQVMRRIANQIPPEEKNNQSDYVIINDNNQLVIPQIIKVHRNLLSIAETI
ncbi:MAG: dephospho-CoA kinase [Bacteroidales bacterium]